jgi:5-methylcytosine-specific restriction endonuclease McrA
MKDSPIISGSPPKRCPACNEIKPIDEFYKDPARKDGHHPTYKKCHARAVKKWQMKNTEKFKEMNKNWKKAHKKQRAEQSKKWAKAHPEYRQEAGKAWRASHPNYGEIWRKKHRDKMNIYARLRRGRLASVRSELTKDEWEAVLEFYGHKCLCCRSTNVKLTIDHVLPISLGGTDTVDNIQPLCGPCNSRKKAKHIDYRKEPYASPRD